jgi:ABC-type uncharacterized transport system ATPase component
MAYRKEMNEQKETIERMREFLEVHELKVYNAEQKIQALKEELASQMYTQLDDTEPSNLVLLDKQPYALDPAARTVLLQKNQKTVSSKSTTKYLSR